MSLGSSRQCAPTCAACDSSIATSATLTPCSQSQIGQDSHLRRHGTAQAKGPSVLSVVVRWGPFGTAVNGTLVARPAEQRCSHLAATAPSSPRRGGPSSVTHRLVGKNPEGSRQPRRETEPSVWCGWPPGLRQSAVMADAGGLTG
jgi:hypothetical protein